LSKVYLHTKANIQNVFRFSTWVDPHYLSNTLVAQCFLDVESLTFPPTQPTISVATELQHTTALLACFETDRD